MSIFNKIYNIQNFLLTVYGLDRRYRMAIKQASCKPHINSDQFQLEWYT